MICRACSSDSNRCNQMHCSFIVRIRRSTIPFCCGVCGWINSCVIPYRFTVLVNRMEQKTSPLSERSVSGLVKRASTPKRDTSASSSVASAAFALPRFDSRHPSSSRVWQSMTRVSVQQRSRGPHQTRAISVDQRSSGSLAIDGMHSARGRLPAGRRRTCQCFSWNMRCTVFLFKPSIQAVVR